MRIFTLATVSLIASPTMALAQQPDISQCVNITNDAERLACFDTAMKQPTAQTNDTDGVVASSSPQNSAALPSVPSQPVSEEASQQKERRLFGFSFQSRTKKPEEFGLRQPKEKTIHQISSPIKSVTYRRKTAYRIELENGQVWEQLGADSNYVKIRENSDRNYSAVIKEAAMGSYKMTVEPMGRTIRVRRIK